MIEDENDYEVLQDRASNHDHLDSVGNTVTAYHFMVRNLNGKFDWEV
jgi:hypothetical protein